MDENTKLGPLARLDLLENLDTIVQTSVQQGANLKCGGKKVPDTYCCYEPTVLTDVDPAYDCFTKETFGPVFSITKASSDEELIRLANQTNFGLSASVWTQDQEKAQRCAQTVQAGSVCINTVIILNRDCRLPFGGFKESGIGRVRTREAVRTFTNEMSTYVKL